MTIIIIIIIIIIIWTFVERNVEIKAANALTTQIWMQ